MLEYSARLANQKATNTMQYSDDLTHSGVEVMF